ncbi:MAG: hypothetical protein JXB26_08485 [Candidatus Aminicenantes bacterium]|nr:hypothetical protein [Candidatus Aminicenantes bacterium]
MLKKLFFLSLALCLLGTGTGLFCGPDEDDRPGKHYVFNLSLYYPISLNKTKNDTVNVNLGLLYSHVGTIKGLDICGLASAASHRLEGLQICGLFAVAGESGIGAQLSGLISVAGESFTGLQISGLMNVDGEEGSVFQTSGLMNIIGENGNGFQVAGLGNVVGQDFKGVQVSAGFNVIGQKGNGVQIAGIFNVCGEDFKGFQAAGLFNVTGENFHGVQTAVFNVAAESKGLQVGAANIAGQCRGVQIGVVNYTKEENNGLPFGLVNLARNGHIGFSFLGGNSVAFTGGIKFSVNRVYSILSMGFFNLEENINKSLTYGFHYGYVFPLGKLYLNTDLGYRYRDNTSLFKHTTQEPDQHMIEGRLLLDIPLSYKISLIFGGGLRVTNTTGDDTGFDSLSPLFVGGLEFH